MCKCSCKCFLCDPPEDLVADLRNGNLDKKTLTKIVSAKGFAVSSAEKLNPENIYNWHDLVRILEEILRVAKQEKKLSDKFGS